MTLARIFKSGNSQAVRLPKEFRFHATEVEIFRRGKEVVLREKPANAGQQLSDSFETMPSMPADFFANGRDDPPQKDVEPW